MGEGAEESSSPSGASSPPGLNTSPAFLPGIPPQQPTAAPPCAGPSHLCASLLLWRWRDAFHSAPVQVIQILSVAQLREAPC